jgi:hypothetical protein
MYAADLSHLSDRSRKSTLYRWKKEMIQRKVVSRSKDRVPKYGVEVDKGLISDINVRISLGLPIDNVILRELLLVRQLLREHGGNHIFGDCWAWRFWNRNDFVLRVATSKMRELPLDLPEQKETYARICARFIYLHRARSMTPFFTRISVFPVLFLVTTFKNQVVFATTLQSSKILADGPIDWFQN